LLAHEKYYHSSVVPGYDDEPDVDVGDTDVGADFGDFGF
jgi:hypothetical protein